MSEPAPQEIEQTFFPPDETGLVLQVAFTLEKDSVDLPGTKDRVLALIRRIRVNPANGDLEGDLDIHEPFGPPEEDINAETVKLPPKLIVTEGASVFVDAQEDNGQEDQPTDRIRVSKKAAKLLGGAALIVGAGAIAAESYYRYKKQ